MAYRQTHSGQTIYPPEQPPQINIGYQVPQLYSGSFLQSSSVSSRWPLGSQSKQISAVKNYVRDKKIMELQSKLH